MSMEKEKETEDIRVESWELHDDLEDVDVDYTSEGQGMTGRKDRQRKVEKTTGGIE